MKYRSIVFGVVFLLCLLALPVIKYVGGRACMPLWVPPLLPAQVVPDVIGFVAAAFLLGAVVRSLIARRDRRWTLGVLAVVVAATGALWFSIPRWPAFLYGLRDRFAGEVGYNQMRQFAEEISQNHPLVNAEGILIRPDRRKAMTTEQTEQWNDLVSRYPFLTWNDGPGHVMARGGLVELTWGSPLVGHWGFQVAPGGEVTDLDPDEGWFLRVARDLQFVNYFD
jgi:hypothetical protein